ncbi:cytochrome P460 family protein [Pseudodesulfovibrio senegalensis]|nr:cytochrome P460 family protein [Pseudodesulfovibrio senegalensis]
MKFGIPCLMFLTVLVFPAFAGDMPGPDAAELWTYVTEIEPYGEWGQWPDHQDMQPGRSPHGPLHVIRVNDAALTKGHPKPSGAIVVKENFSSEKELMAITVMYKVKDYNPMAGDWFWVKYSPDGTVLKEGKPKGCIACHGARADEDYIMVSDY